MVLSGPLSGCQKIRRRVVDAWLSVLLHFPAKRGVIVRIVLQLYGVIVDRVYFTIILAVKTPKFDSYLLELFNF